MKFENWLILICRGWKLTGFVDYEEDKLFWEDYGELNKN